MLLYYLGSWNWEQGSCKARASYMLRLGDWDHIRDMISPCFRPHRGQGQSQACQESLPVNSLPTIVNAWVQD